MRGPRHASLPAEIFSGLDIQLKILQSLPTLLQNYADHLEGDLHATILQLCTTLLQVKTAAVSNTASATLQQTVSLLFERVEVENGTTFVRRLSSHLLTFCKLEQMKVIHLLTCSSAMRLSKYDQRRTTHIGYS